MLRAPEPTDIELITVPRDRLRAIDGAAVSRLAASIAEMGLRTPITVLDVNGGERLDLVAGAHRLAAAKQLGLTHIDCIVIEGDELDARLWEVAENLHRAELTKEQRDEHIRLYAGLLQQKEREVSTQIASKPSGGRPTAIASKVAAQTGLSKDTVRRALNPERAANERARSRIDADVKQRAAREVAEMIAERFPGDMWDAVKANLYAAGASNIAHELTNLTGQSIMDGRYAA